MRIEDGLGDLGLANFQLVRTVSCSKDQGEIYSLAVDEKYLLTGHTQTATCIQLWTIDGEDIIPTSEVGSTMSNPFSFVFIKFVVTGS